MMKEKVNKSIACLRVLACEMINKAASGHPGIALGISPMLYTLFTKHININTKLEKWQNRDRFILSAGHGSAILYALLHLVGFNISINDLKKFRQIDSITPGHPENWLTSGVEAITGPLGQGIGVAVGCALAETIQAARFNEHNHKIVNHYTYAITSDGDLQEGVSYESISLAGHWKLNKLIVLFDSNDIQLDSKVKIVQSENMKKRFESANWNYILVKNGNDEQEIDNAINEAKKSKSKPTIIEIKTIIGYGSSNQGTTSVHGEPIFDDIKNLKKHLDWNEENDFVVPRNVYKDFSCVQERGEKKYKKWSQILKDYSIKYPEKHQQFLNEINKNFNFDYKKFIAFAPRSEQATRVSSGSIISKLVNEYPILVGGSADLSASTKVMGGDGIYQHNNRKGRNIMYGVREFTMATINNGLAIYGGIIPFSSTFFTFSDYMKPAIRLGSMMKLQQIYLFTHDSIIVGEDGPTHQPIEQLAIFRAQPNINVFRPADYKETLSSYMYALKESKNTPSIIVLTRQNVEQLKETIYENTFKGAYIITKELGANITIIATGSEVALALKIKNELIKTGVKINIVSMPCQELFNKQSIEYRNEILPFDHIKISLELGSTFGWNKYTGLDGMNIGIDTFGYSGKGEDVLAKIKFTPKDIANKIIKFLNNKTMNK